MGQESFVGTKKIMFFLFYSEKFLDKRVKIYK